jgi:hypothetical protein
MLILRRRALSVVTIALVFCGLAGATAAADTSAAAAISTAAALQTPSLRAQAQQLYTPAGLFYRSLTAAQKTRLGQAAKLDGKRIDACQAPYAKRLLVGFRVGSERYKLYALYEHGALMQQYQSRVAVVAPELKAAAWAWAQMTLANKTMQRFAHALAAEFATSLNHPKFHTCEFIRQLARHHFSLAWAQHSPSGEEAQQWWNDISGAGIQAGAFWNYIQSKRIERQRLLSTAQLTKLANLPGEIS